MLNTAKELLKAFMTEKPDPLRDALTTAKHGLGTAVRALIANGIHDGTAERNRLEDAFEKTKNALARDAW